MRVAFYAPLKPPSHPTPSGDRRIARLLLRALRKAGHEVRVVSTLRSYEGEGVRAKQDVIERRGAAEAQRLLRTKLKRWRPQAWFTYHLYQKAPDWLGPPIAKRLGIPYLVAEAAYAPTRSEGRWDRGLRAVEAALRRADTVLMLNPDDEECVAPLLRRRAGALDYLRRELQIARPMHSWLRHAASRPAAAEPMLPFLATKPYRDMDPRESRRALARRYGIPAGPPWLLAVGMMRAGDKLASYRLLGRALSGLLDRPWRLLVVGDGPARNDVVRAFAWLEQRVHWLGKLSESGLMPVYAAADLLVWPAINEAIGMSILEAQAAGLPAVAGNRGAIPTIVAHGVTGLLVPEGKLGPFHRAVQTLLDYPEMRQGMSFAAMNRAARLHDIALAADQLDHVLRAAVARAKKRRRR